MHEWQCYWVEQLPLKNLWNHGGGSYVIRWQTCLPNCGQKCSFVRWVNFNKKMFHTNNKKEFRWKKVSLSDSKEKVLNAGNNFFILYEVVAKNSNRVGLLLLLLLPPTFCHYRLLKTQGIWAWKNDLRKNFYLEIIIYTLLKRGDNPFVQPHSSHFLNYAFLHFSLPIMCNAVWRSEHWVSLTPFTELPVLHQHELSLFFLIL